MRDICAERGHSVCQAPAETVQADIIEATAAPGWSGTYARRNDRA